MRKLLSDLFVFFFEENESMHPSLIGLQFCSHSNCEKTWRKNKQTKKKNENKFELSSL